MKTLREIQDEVANSYNFENAETLIRFANYKISYAYIYDLMREVQKQQQCLINKIVEEDWLSGDFDTQSIINDKNIIR